MKVLKGRYYPRTSFLQAKLDKTTSYTWKSIFHAKRVLDEVAIWRVGDGKNIHVWEDRWINSTSKQKIISLQPQNCDVLMVSNLIDPYTRRWDNAKIHELLLPFKANIITNILMWKTTTDNLLWRIEKSNTFFLSV